jgi:undecaprenyl-diphosphatase
MTFLQAFILGIVQGLTEFIPVSSSGHLVIVPWLLNWNIDPEPAFVFDVLVQWGTLLALIVYFRADLISMLKAFAYKPDSSGDVSKPEKRIGQLILLSTIPGLIGGLLLKSLIENAINSPLWVSIFLMVTGGFLFAAEKLGRRQKRISAMSNEDAIWIGISQILSLFPGISRSGSTITAGMLRGLIRKDAARFSFLMTVPIMIAAGIIALIDLYTHPDTLSQVGPILVGFLVATFVGYLSIRWLLRYLSERSLNIFSGYCILVGLGGVILVMVNG